MPAIIKDSDFLKNIKNSSNLNFSVFERFNRVLSFLELPFFFDDEVSNFYRFEGSIYNFNYEITYRNFSIDINLGLKVKTKLLMSMFMQMPSANDIVDRKFSLKTSFLLNNGFSPLNKQNVFAQSVNVNKSNDYFPILSSELSTKNLLNFSTQLSDLSLDLLSSHNKFHRILNSNMYDVDTFISTLNSNWVDFNNLAPDFHLNFARSLTVVNDNQRTFSFLVSSLDGFKILHSKFFNKYLYFKKAIWLNRLNRCSYLFNPFYSKNYYLFSYNFFINKLDTFFITNFNLLYTYKYIIKLLLFILLNFKIDYFSKFVYSAEKKSLFVYLISNILFNSSFVKNNNFYKYSTIKYLKTLLFFFKNKSTDFLSTNLNSFSKLFVTKRKNLVINQLNISNFFCSRLSRLVLLKRKKCYHGFSLHYQPSVIFASVSRLGYGFSSIFHLTNFKNMRTKHYSERAVGIYYQFLKFFSDFILSFFKRNFVSSLLKNYYYNPKYLIFRYFSIFKLLFPLIFKRWVFNNLSLNLNISELSSILNYLNYSLLTKNNYPWKKRYKRSNKKYSLKTNFPKITKVYNFKQAKFFKRNARFFSTVVNCPTKDLINVTDFDSTLKVLFLHNFNKWSYNEFSVLLGRPALLFKSLRLPLFNYLKYLLFCFFFNFKSNVRDFFFKFNFFSIHLNFIIDYKFLILLENFSLNLSHDLFYNYSNLPILRFKDFTLKLDFYVFIILKRFVEYFRLFKYNEYLSFNAITGKNYYDHFSKHIPNSYFLHSFFNFKRSLFFNKYLIYKFYYKKADKLLSNNTFTYNVLYNVSFFKFFAVISYSKKFLSKLLLFFSFYLISNIHYYTYKALVKSSKRLQLAIGASTGSLAIDDLHLGLDGFESYFNNNNISYNMVSFISTIYFKMDLINDYSLFFNGCVDSIVSFNSKTNLLLNTVDILLIDYLDEKFFDELLSLESMNTVDVISFTNSMISKFYIEFLDLKAIKSIDFFNINSLKFKIDKFIWLVFNSAFISNYHSSYFNNLNLFVNKIAADNYFKKLSDSSLNLINQMVSSFNYAAYFLLYTFIRDFSLKLFERVYFFNYFIIWYLSYMLINYFKFIQFSKLTLIRIRINYYKVFDDFLNLNFNYLI